MMLKTKVSRALVAVAIAAAMLPAMSEAGFVAGGNTNIMSATDSTFEGTINFGVYNSTSAYGGGGGIGDTWGVGDATFNTSFMAGTDSSVLDTSVYWLYLFQVVNNGPGGLTDPVIRAASASIEAALVGGITSWGAFAGRGFNDGAEVTAANDFGEDTQLFAVDAVADSFPAPLPMGTIGGVTTLSPGTYVSTLSVDLGTTSFGASFGTVGPFGEGVLFDGNRSTIFGFTTNLAPHLVIGSLIDGSPGSGTVISPGSDESTAVPAPTGLLALASLATVGFGAFYRRRRVLVKS